VTLYTSVNESKINNSVPKTILVYILITAFCVVFNKIYFLFGHGVTSASMSLMFLYPLALGALVFAILWISKINTKNTAKYRLYYNIYNSGIAALISGSMIKGIFEIAGTSSHYTALFFILGWLFIAFSLVVFVITIIKQKSRY